MKIFIKFFIILFFSFFLLNFVDARNVGEETIKNGLIGISQNNIITGEARKEDGIDSAVGIVKWLKDTLMGLLVLVAVGAFLYIGVKLAVARGNPEEFKKAMMHFVYAIIGIFIISAAWAIVKLVAGINI